MRDATEKELKRISDLLNIGETPLMIVHRMLKANYTEKWSWIWVNHVMGKAIA